MVLAHFGMAVVEGAAATRFVVGHDPQIRPLAPEAAVPEGSGNIVEAVRHMRTVMTEIKRVTRLDREELVAESKNFGAPLSLVQQVSKLGKLPVPNFAAGGIATPADASLMMQLGAESVFVGSGIFKSDDPAARAKAVVEATTHYKDPKIVAKASTGLKNAMRGLDMSEIPEEERLQERGW